MLGRERTSGEGGREERGKGGRVEEWKEAWQEEARDTSEVSGSTAASMLEI